MGIIKHVLFNSGLGSESEGRVDGLGLTESEWSMKWRVVEGSEEMRRRMREQVEQESGCGWGEERAQVEGGNEDDEEKEPGALVSTNGRHGFEKVYHFGGWWGGQANIHSEYKLTFAARTRKTYLSEITREKFEEYKKIFDLLNTAEKACSLVEIFSYDWMTDIQQPVMTMEYCNGGDLAHFCMPYETANLRIPERFICMAFMDISRALAFMHHGLGCKFEVLEKHWTTILHRDLKPENVFVVNPESERPIFKLGDFDLSALHDPENPEQCDCGTYSWQAPEQYAEYFKPTPTMKGKIWTVGAIVQYMALGFRPREPCVASRCAGPEHCGAHAPYTGSLFGDRAPDEARKLDRIISEESAQMEKIFRKILPKSVQGIKAASIGEPDGYSDELHDWMLSCMHKNPMLRPGAKDLVRKMLPVAEVVLQRPQIRTETAKPIEYEQPEAEFLKTNEHEFKPRTAQYPKLWEAELQDGFKIDLHKLLRDP